MEIRVLRYFLEVAREGSVTRAAQRLHISQPTLSKQLKDLEAELGKKLFTRGSFSVRLTDEGMLLRKRAEDSPLANRRVLPLSDAAEMEFICLHKGKSLRTITDLYCQMAGFSPGWCWSATARRRCGS